MVIASPAQSIPHRDPLRALLAPSTWLTAAHLLLDAVMGMAYAFVLGLGLVFTIVLLPLALLGVPVWIVTTWVSAGMARLELVRYRVLLGVEIDRQPMPPSQRNPLRYGGVLWRDPGVRRRAVHQLLSAPLGVLTTVITYLLLSAALALLGCLDDDRAGHRRRGLGAPAERALPAARRGRIRDRRRRRRRGSVTAVDRRAAARRRRRRRPDAAHPLRRGVAGRTRDPVPLAVSGGAGAVGRWTRPPTGSCASTATPAT
jgi:Putative sensor